MEMISNSPAETVAVGETWGREAGEGLVIGLTGDLGAGKTQLVKGLARGLDIPGRVHSPTFTLVNVYTGGRLVLFHIDLFRFPVVVGTEKIIAAGLDEYLSPAGVAVIEWADRWLPEAPPSRGYAAGWPLRYRRVRIEVLAETTRRIIHEDFSA